MRRRDPHAHVWWRHVLAEFDPEPPPHRHERFFGATGIQVPQLLAREDLRLRLKLNGILDEILELTPDQLDDEHLREPFLAGVPIICSVASTTELLRALRRPEVACALVEQGSPLLEVDIVALTYATR